MQACHDADRRGLAWVRALRHVVCLASPHHGAPLAKGVHLAAEALARVPETRAFARILDLRSAGVRDLRHGSVEEIPFVAGATYYAVSATVTRDPAHPFGRIVGDLLVRHESASGRGPRGRRVPFEVRHGHHAGGLHHFHVVNDPDDLPPPPRLARAGLSRLVRRGAARRPGGPPPRAAPRRPRRARGSARGARAG